MEAQPGRTAQTTSLLAGQAELVSAMAGAVRRALAGGEAGVAAASEAFALDERIGLAAQSLARTVRNPGSDPFGPGSAEDLAKALDDVAEAMHRGVEAALPTPASVHALALADAIAHAGRTLAAGVLAACGDRIDRQAALAAVSGIESSLSDVDPSGAAEDPVGLALQGAAERMVEAAGILRDIAYDAR